MVEVGVNATDEYDFNFFTGQSIEADTEFDLRFLSFVGNARERQWNWGISYYRPWMSAAGGAGLYVTTRGTIREEQDVYRTSLALGRGFLPFEDATGGTSYRLALGASLDLNYSTADAKTTLPGVSLEDKPDALEEGYSLGVLLHIFESKNFGVKVGGVYHSGEELDFDFRAGEEFFDGLTWDVPEQFSVGPSIRISPFVTVNLTYEQIKWSDALSVNWFDDEERYAVGTEILVPVAEIFTVPVRFGYSRSENDGNFAQGSVGGVTLDGDYTGLDYTSELFSLGAGFVLADRHFFDFAYGYLKLDRFDQSDDVNLFSMSYAITF